ncbi:O-antigen ligase family protein [bacterium SCSIO 12741]|nr:O-antigen ligase family protein [bacterium SCSIO 12741]
MLDRILNYRNAYLLGLCGVFFSLSVSVFVISTAEIFLALIWIAEGDYANKWKRLKSNRFAWLFMSLFLMLVLGLSVTQNFDYALNDIRIKLPLLILPLFMASYPPLKRGEQAVVGGFFLLGLLISTIFSYFRFLDLSQELTMDVRESSAFISHVRLSLMLALAIIGLVITWFRNLRVTWAFPPIILLITWFLFILFRLQMITGLALLGTAAFACIIWMVLRSSRPAVRWVGGGLLAFTLISSGFYVHQVVGSFIHPDPSPPKNLVDREPTCKFRHSPERTQVENGHLVWAYMCDFEAEASWEARSEYSFSGKGKTGEYIQATLYRFLASLNLTKDSAGIAQLSDKDIRAIEDGETNYLYAYKESLAKRIYGIAWELYGFADEKYNPEGTSVGQRLEFWKAARHVIQNHFWMGVGTGDVVDEMRGGYEATGSRMSKEYWLKPHNQYLTTWVCFGIIGLIWFVLVFAYPLKSAFKDPLILAFWLIVIGSMLTEDTLETQVGVTFVTAFFGLLVMANPKVNPKELPSPDQE